MDLINLPVQVKLYKILYNRIKAQKVYIFYGLLMRKTDAVPNDNSSLLNPHSQII